MIALAVLVILVVLAALGGTGRLVADSRNPDYTLRLGSTPRRGDKRD